MMKESNYDTGIERTRVPTPSNHETSFVQKAVFLWGLEIARKNAQNAMSPRGVTYFACQNYPILAIPS